MEKEPLPRVLRKQEPQRTTWKWDDKPVIFDVEHNVPATTRVQRDRELREWAEIEEEAEFPSEERERICPWCGVLCESVEALAVHEEGCE